MPTEEPLYERFKNYLGDAWLRLEPRSRALEVEDGLAAHIADPLWMLARQWQTGEFQGEDAGSPLLVTTDYSTHHPTTYQLGGDPTTHEINTAPLEKYVEQEWLGMDWRTAVQVGQQMEGTLRARHPEAILPMRSLFPIVIPAPEADVDEDTRRFLHFMAGRAMDGKTLLAWIQGEALTELSREEAAEQIGVPLSALNTCIDEVLNWCRLHDIKVQAQRPPAWRNAQLDHRFSVGCEKAGQYLTAPSYQRGELDWYSFHALAALHQIPGHLWQAQPKITTLPTQVRLQGTALRWWEFEDGATHFGDIDAETVDLARMLFIEFVMGYADDWFSVPIPVETPSLVRIDNITVFNVFGEKSSGAPDGFTPAFVPDPDPLRRWEVFTLTPAQKDGGQELPGIPDPASPGIGAWDANLEKSLLFLPPLGGRRDESSALEEVHFLRDEGANLVWAKEETVRNGLGRPVHGEQPHRERNARQRRLSLREWEAQLAVKLEELAQLPDTATEEERQALEADIQTIREEISRLEGATPARASEVPRYRLSTTVPDNWVPLLPVNISDTPEVVRIHLRRAHLLHQHSTEAIPAYSRLLRLEGRPDDLLVVEESAIPRAGRRVLLTAHRLRGVDGKTHVWWGRKVRTGGGEERSGLEFDTLY